MATAATGTAPESLDAALRWTKRHPRG